MAPAAGGAHSVRFMPTPPLHPFDSVADAAKRALIHARTGELARIAGRTPPHVVQADYEQARRELPDAPAAPPVAVAITPGD